MYDVKVERTSAPKQKPLDESKLGFGTIFTDHMLMIEYDKGQGWHDARIVPYGPIAMDPAAMCLHYGQEIFEGMKAYRGDDGSVYLFRPQENFKRLNSSCERMCIPQMDEALLLESLKMLVELDSGWIPAAKDSSLYIRPFIIATEPKLGVKSSDSYLYMVLLSPSGPYYPSGLDPVKIYVEQSYVRSVRGGTGMVKTGGNYAAALKAQDEAHEQDYSQVLWLDGVERKYIEEVGAMNMFFVLGDEVVTPALLGSILPGITRKSVIEMLRSWGMKVSERRISIDEVAEAYKNGQLKEAFGTGTAAVISPVGELKHGDLVMTINGGKIGPVSQRLYDALTAIQWGRAEDPFGWRVKVK
ncbi:MAG: branched-chain amino acid aminotransferase [Clostridiales bacterium]|uniref:branched-chain amino acid aminotransferase n=1 Tax=Oscillospiraceae TaxID=216572 RepID=UPI0009A5775B|nr:MULTISPECIES: branched-chain amino acid aminotransferase [Oscillospiraceae]PWM38921.1 MAG: branched-chain amino acid aminotransferase [Clostridiales bacterium]RGB68862.1 branched-chain amino acid aminotransferase [Harryflintia acetispora]